MSDDNYLMDLPDSPSPCMLWLAAHDLFTRRDELPHTFVPCDQSKQWVCANRAMTSAGFGDDEREATLDYAQRHGVNHWLVEDWERMVSVATEGLSLD